MFFTRITQVVASIIFLISIVQIAVAIAIAADWIGPIQELMPRYFPGFRTTGEVINRGTVYIAVALALGVLAEISLAVRRNT